MGYEIWAVPPGASPLKSDYTYTSEAKCCKFGHDGSYAVGDLGGNTRYYLSNYNLQWTNILPNTSASPVSSLTFSPKNNVFAVAYSATRNIPTFNYLTSNISTLRVITNNKTLAIEYSPDGLYLASG
jgi:WD40 repeat protein